MLNPLRNLRQETFPHEFLSIIALDLKKKKYIYPTRDAQL